MSLRLKFGILLAVLATAVALAIGFSWWAVGKLESEVREPFRGMSGLLLDLGRIKREVEELGLIVGGTSDAPAAGTGVRSFLETPRRFPNDSDKRDFRFAAQRALAVISQVESSTDQSAEWTLRAGRNALSNVHQRLSASIELGTQYLNAQLGDTQDESGRTVRPRERAGRALYEVHELIERLEGKVLDDTTEAINFGDTIRAKLIYVMVTILLAALLTAVLGIVLIRRWVLTPVNHLRVATARLAAGDFTHRVPVTPGASADELAKLATEVNHMAGMIKTMQDDRVEQERFAAIGEMVRRLAHNLRNPLGGIRGLAETTRNELLPGPATADLADYQTKIIATVDRFEQWLKDLLNVTRPADIQLETTSIAPWLIGLVEAHRPLATTRGVRLDLDLTDAPQTAAFDYRHMEHAVSAILSNAIEAAATPKSREKAAGGPLVRVSVVRNLSETGQTWDLNIADTGPGIPADLREQVFKPYFTTKHDGNGIGLAVALKAVKSHGGRIWIQSPVPHAPTAFSNDPDQPPGTQFTIRLPLTGQ